MLKMPQMCPMLRRRCARCCQVRKQHVGRVDSVTTDSAMFNSWLPRLDKAARLPKRKGCVQRT